MTRALCLGCGAIKHGALNPCTRCRSRGTGNRDIDIAFSDHFTSASTLSDLGSVIKSINMHESVRQEVRRWAFLTYVTEHCPEILKAEPPEGIQDDVADFYRSLGLPDVEWKPGNKNSPPSAAGPRLLKKLSMVIVLMAIIYGVFGPNPKIWTALLVVVVGLYLNAKWEDLKSKQRMKRYSCTYCRKSIDYEYLNERRNTAKEAHKQRGSRYLPDFDSWYFDCPHCQREHIFIERPREVKRKKRPVSRVKK